MGKTVRAFGLLVVALAVGCSSAPPTNDPLVNCTLWVQDSAEYRALAHQAYNTARVQLELALAVTLLQLGLALRQFQAHVPVIEAHQQLPLLDTIPLDDGDPFDVRRDTRGEFTRPQ